MGSTESFLGRVASNNQKDMSEEKPTEFSDPTESPPPFLGRSDGHWQAVAAAITSLAELMVTSECNYHHQKDARENYWELISIVKEKARVSITESGATE